jgi:hypothetical protein
MSPKRILLLVVVMSLLALAIGIGSQPARPVQAVSPEPIDDSIGAFIPYLGQLTDEAGKPVADGAAGMPACTSTPTATAILNSRSGAPTLSLESF